jgi:hypothetical protein
MDPHPVFVNVVPITWSRYLPSVVNLVRRSGLFLFAPEGVKVPQRVFLPVFDRRPSPADREYLFVILISLSARISATVTSSSPLSRKARRATVTKIPQLKIGNACFKFRGIKRLLHIHWSRSRAEVQP